MESLSAIAKRNSARTSFGVVCPPVNLACLSEPVLKDIDICQPPMADAHQEFASGRNLADSLESGQEETDPTNHAATLRESAVSSGSSTQSTCENITGSEARAGRPVPHRTQFKPSKIQSRNSGDYGDSVVFGFREFGTISTSTRTSDAGEAQYACQLANPDLQLAADPPLRREQQLIPMGPAESTRAHRDLRQAQAPIDIVLPEEPRESRNHHLHGYAGWHTVVGLDYTLRRMSGVQEFFPTYNVELGNTSQLSSFTPIIAFDRITARDSSLIFDMSSPVAMPELHRSNRGLNETQSIASYLKEFSFDRDRMNSDSINNHEKCVICLDDYSPGMTLLTLPCQHFFCQCVLRWLKTSPTCPICIRCVALGDKS